ncbi:MAG: hypothetical protein LBI03_04140 [Clostridiales bacterium]|jgi:hypothetical protein|nr:hypothetical protein [Clostridiales bacterium]
MDLQTISQVSKAYDISSRMLMTLVVNLKIRYHTINLKNLYGLMQKNVSIV